MRPRLVLLAFLLILIPNSLISANEKPEKQAFSKGSLLFAKEILPLFQRKCLGCHGDDPKIRGGLDLRSRKTLLVGGDSGVVLVPGHAEKSKLYLSVLRKGDVVMPPKERNRLTKSEINALKAWINAGAPWPDEAQRKVLLSKDWSGPKDGVRVATSGGLSAEWTNRRYKKEDIWAFQPVKKVELPWRTLAEGRPKHPIDAFIVRRLQQQKIIPAGQADKRILIRRITFDLTGLPPAPEAVHQFQKDDSPQAFDKLIDRLLASKHYGERMAQHWLDVVRYADTDGFSRDTFRKNAWKYRDYVIRSFNEDKPYNQFVLEQIAGDQLHPQDPKMQAAVSFLWMGPWEHTSMSVASVTRQLWLDDVTHSVGITFLAQGMMCAKCHDHKFDPIPTRDYYRMQAVFSNTTHRGRKGYEIRPQRPQPIHILVGGSLENRGEKVSPGVLSAISLSKDSSHSQAKKEGSRLQLARWIANAENPLTARVMVNRVWQMHFGRGLVASANNFGKMGEQPTHPELLDWLATWFVENDWSVKKLHRLILTSRTYQRAGHHPDPEALDKADPKNELLAYFPPRRMTAEELRDAMLAASGELNRQVGGPSIFPEINWEVAFQPRLSMGRLMEPYQPNSRKEDRNRRTLYVVRQRNLPNPFLTAFNQPGTEMSCEKRDETTITPQAFTLFKGQYAHQRALAFAHRLRKSAKTLDDQIKLAYRLAFARSPSEKELDLCRKHVEKMTAHHQQFQPKPSKLPTSVTLKYVKEQTGEVVLNRFRLERLQNYERDLMPWNVDAETRGLAELCLVLYNSSEFLYVY